MVFLWCAVGGLLYFCDMRVATMVFNVFQIFALLAFHSYAIQKTRIMQEKALKAARENPEGHSSDCGHNHVDPRPDVGISSSYKGGTLGSVIESRREHEDFVASIRGRNAPSNTEFV